MTSPIARVDEEIVGAQAGGDDPTALVAHDLASRLRGRLIGPHDADYEAARAVWNGMIDRRPAAIARCADAQDVAVAVSFAREHGFALAVRGGGHGVAGHAVADGALVVDLSDMRHVSVDPQRRTVRAQGGCTLADLDRATQPFGLATPLGVVTETGIAGLTLSGGMGWLRCKHGLSCDNLTSAEVVTADGVIRTASAEENPDLFWAIRGGGGNFGVVTSLEYRLHPVGPEVFVCFVFYPARLARHVVDACTRLLSERPAEVAPLAVLGTVPDADEFPAARHGEPFVALLAVYPGHSSEGERVLAELRGLAEPIADLSATMPYVEAQGVLDADYPDGQFYYWKSVTVPELSDEVLDRLVALAAEAPSPASTIDVWFQGGAMSAVAETDTAFANRSAPYLLGIEGNWDAAEDSERNVAWVRRVFDDMSSRSDAGVYLNFPGFLEEGEWILRKGYGVNFERLAEVKARYDPQNLFRLNPNVEPTTG